MTVSSKQNQTKVKSPPRTSCRFVCWFFFPSRRGQDTQHTVAEITMRLARHDTTDRGRCVNTWNNNDIGILTGVLSNNNILFDISKIVTVSMHTMLQENCIQGIQNSVYDKILLANRTTSVAWTSVLIGNGMGYCDTQVFMFDKRYCATLNISVWYNIQLNNIVHKRYCRVSF